MENKVSDTFGVTESTFSGREHKIVPEEITVVGKQE
jgi:hypothetical protein